MQGFPLSLLIGLRFSKGRRRSGMVSFISVISTIGITLGVAVLIVVLSAMNGFERELKNRILAVVPHGEIVPLKQPYEYKNWHEEQKRINSAPNVVASSPFITLTGLVENGVKMKAIQLRAVIPADEAKMGALPQFVKGMSWDAFKAGEQQVILGQGVAEQIGVSVGDWISVSLPGRETDNISRVTQPKRVRLQVVGILDLVGDLGFSFGLLPLADAQEYLDYGDSITGFSLRVTDLYNANKLISSAANYVNRPAYISSWMSKYGRMHRDIQLVRSTMYIAMILVIGVACFNIVSTLVMAVKDKSADIAILRTLGAGDRLIRAIFIWYGLLAGLIGSSIGVLIGVVMSLKLTAIIKFLENILDHQFLSGGIYFIDFLPSELHFVDIVVVLATAMVLSLIASWYPAQRASRINPARVLSGQ